MWFYYPVSGSQTGGSHISLLVILVADALFSLLSKVVLGKHIHSVKASQNGPEISHLLFADDNLLFARANRQKYKMIVDILNKYEVASGQKINIEKTEISFRKGVCDVQRQELTEFLAMRQVNRHPKYLGVPTLQ